MEFNPDKLVPGERYKLLIGCIVPRPIAFVSTISPDGRPNLAPFSFFNGIGSDPMTLLFCPGHRPDIDAEKDTLRNCKPRDEGGTGEFVVNAAIETYQQRVAAAAEPLDYGQSEFDAVGLTRAPSMSVKPPRVAESPWAFECETMQVIRIDPANPDAGNVVIGRVVHVFVRDDIVDERMHVDPEKLRAIGRLGGQGYCTIRDRFEMPRGLGALDESWKVERRE